MPKDQPSHLSIKKWAESDRPREKLLAQGRRALTDAELLAILVGSGSRNESAVELCRRILHENKHDLNLLSKRSVPELCEHVGIGEAKAISIVAALELGRRRKEQASEALPVLNNSRSVYQFIQDVYRDLPHEEFWVLYLNTGCRLITKELIGRGGNDFTPVDVRIIMRKALECRASSMILTHNHPSGTISPSALDKRVTEKIVAASSVFDIQVNDHVIFTDNGYYSFSDDGLLEGE